MELREHYARGMEVREGQSRLRARLLFFFSSCGFPVLSALNQQVDNRADLRKGSRAAKETGQMSVALRGRMHTLREAFNQRSQQNLSPPIHLSCSLYLCMVPCIPRLYDRIRESGLG